MPDTGLPEWAVVSPKRRAHIERVAALADRWASVMGVPPQERTRWLKAVWLHDAVRDASEEDLASVVPDATGPKALWHGPAAAALAYREGERDEGILDAVRYHSLGYHNWERVGQVLYCADYLEPGRSFERGRRAALATQFPEAPAVVLLEVARARLGNLIARDLPIPEPSWRFWNALVTR